MQKESKQSIKNIFLNYHLFNKYFKYLKPIVRTSGPYFTEKEKEIIMENVNHTYLS